MQLADKKIYIIGQGIAGSVLAFLLDQNGYEVHIIDDDHLSSSSMVAAGMWNPVSFKRMSRSWRADMLLPIAEKVYSTIESQLNCKFYHPLELVKIFPNAKTANKWDEQSLHPELSDYLTSKQDKDVAEQFAQPFGHGVVQQSGWLDIPVLITGIRQYFSSKQRLTIATFDNETKEEILAKDNNALIIYCTGWKNTHLFADEVKVIPNKGELLTITSNDLRLERMVNFGKFLIPIGHQKFRLGATYGLNQPDISITPEGKEEILSQIENHYKKEVSIIEHLSGYRPTTIDRMPIIGFHPDNKQIGIFNGFGSKGVMLVPYFAVHFIEHIATGSPIMKEARLNRYFNKK